MVQNGGSAHGVSGPAHTFGPDCPHCGDGDDGVRCDLSAYSPRRVRFILAHREAYESAYLNPDSSGAAAHEQERLEREYHTLPPRHDCSCHCPYERRGYPRCGECKRLDDQRVNNDIPVEIGRTSRVEAPMPSPVMLDLARAEKVLGKKTDAAALAPYMSLNGSSLAEDVDIDQHLTHPVAVERELMCLMCSRPAVTGQKQCQHCGGCLVVATVA